MVFDFDTPIDRRGTGSSKWDMMETLYGVSPEDGLSMWTADSDYATAPCVTDRIRAAADHGVFGYMPEYDGYLKAVAWWMANRHGWQIKTDWVLTTQGLGNAVALCIDIWSAPGDGVVTFTPVYHEFANKIRRAGRRVVECPLARDADGYSLDLDDAQSRLSGDERVLLWCSPQNPSGRVWTVEELRAVADFAERNDLILVSDEIHHDLVYQGERFVPMHVAAPEKENRMVVLTAASKTFNIAGLRTGNVIIPDDDLRDQMRTRLRMLDYQPSTMGMMMIEAAYSPEGAEWLDAQIAHLARNRAAFDAAVNAIPGVRSMPLQATYLAWVDFSGTGMSQEEITRRVHEEARIAPSAGPTFGTGGEGFMRFNLATTHDRVVEAGERLQKAFSDLQ